MLPCLQYLCFLNVALGEGCSSAAPPCALGAPMDPSPIHVYFTDMVTENSSDCRTQLSMYPNKLHLKKEANPPAETSLLALLRDG